MDCRIPRSSPESRANGFILVYPESIRDFHRLAQVRVDMYHPLKKPRRDRQALKTIASGM
jgi:hypothetical protein